MITTIGAQLQAVSAGPQSTARVKRYAMTEDRSIDAVIDAFSGGQSATEDVADADLSSRTTGWMMEAVTGSLSEATVPTDKDVLARSQGKASAESTTGSSEATGAETNGEATSEATGAKSGGEVSSEVTAVKRDGVEVSPPPLQPGGNTYEIGSQAWIEYGKAYGVWFPYPQGVIESMVGELDPGVDRSYGFSHALQEFETVLEEAGVSYEGAPISEQMMKDCEPDSPLLAEVQTLIAETRKRIDAEGLKDADADQCWREALAEAKRCIVASLPEGTELPTAAVSMLGYDAMSEAAWVARVDYESRSARASRAFAMTFQDGYLEATKFMNLAAATASDEQLTALAEEAMKKRRLDYRVIDNGDGDNVDEEKVTQATEGYEGYSDSVARDLMAERLFWVHMRMGDKDWSFGNVMEQLVSMSGDGGDDTWQETKDVGLGETITVTKSGRIDIANKIIEDGRAAVNLEAMNYAQIEGMRQVASELGVDVYDSKAKLSEDISRALEEFRDDHQAELLRLARVDPEAFNQLTRAMVLIVQAAVEGRVALEAALERLYGPQEDSQDAAA